MGELRGTKGRVLPFAQLLRQVDRLHLVVFVFSVIKGWSRKKKHDFEYSRLNLV